ncbi:hypothetical protein GCM10020358_45710 [Amorphoplanes nipponensis]|uniref:hypothetical protein n=1 Tax=Actinoplanes nipponensis TaxID=135950 RepID=UPI0031E6FA74
MSYATQPPAVAPAATTAPRRPAAVTSAAVLLILMALVGLGYAIATVAVAPGTVDRFRAAAGGANSVDVDGFVTVIWIGAALAAVLAVILFALYVVLALGLRRGSNAARIATWVVAGLGLLAGCASTVTVAVQRSGDPVEGSLSAALSDAYPGGWIPVNIGLAVAQMVGYVLVGVLLLASPGTFFGRAPKPLPPDPFAAPAHGGGGPGYGMPGVPGPGPGPGYGAGQAYGPPGAAGAGYGAPGAPGLRLRRPRFGLWRSRRCRLGLQRPRRCRLGLQRPRRCRLGLQRPRHSWIGLWPSQLRFQRSRRGRFRPWRRGQCRPDRAGRVSVTAGRLRPATNGWLPDATIGGLRLGATRRFATGGHLAGRRARRTAARGPR